MSVKPSRVLMAAYAAIGAVAPDIVLLYSKRFTMPFLTFSLAQYAGATLLYLALAAALAVVFPFKGRPTPYKAFALGVALPLVIAALAALSRNPMSVPRGGPIPGEFLDLLSFR